MKNRAIIIKVLAALLALSAMFQAGALIELSGDVETAFEIYCDNYDIHELPPLG